MKNKTNRQVLTKAIKDLSDIELVFLRERHIISPDLYIESMRNIKAKVDFEWWKHSV
jgi:hypothetical protein